MTLPASGPISFNAINVELGLSGTANKSINDANYRTLAGVPSGLIDLQDFYGKSAEVILDTQTVVASVVFDVQSGDPKAPTYTDYYGFYTGFISGASCTDGSSNLYSGATIKGIYWDDNFSAGTNFYVSGNRANSGWTTMRITHTFSGTVTNLSRASATYVFDSVDSRWTWFSTGNLFPNTTSGQNSYVVTFIQ